MAKRSKKLEDAVSELESWLPNYDFDIPKGKDRFGEKKYEMGFPHLVARILASLPGGDRLDDMGIEGFSTVGWKEADMLGKLLEAVEDSGDVAYAVDQLFDRDEDEDEMEGNTGEFRALSHREVDALQTFRTKHGRNWKDALRGVWDRSNPRTDLEGEVYPLRNSHGPRWLIRYRLP